MDGLLRELVYGLVVTFVIWLIRAAVKKMSEPSSDFKEQRSPQKTRKSFLISLGFVFVTAIICAVDINVFVTVFAWICFSIAFLSAWGAFDNLYSFVNEMNSDGSYTKSKDNSDSSH